MLKGIKSVLCLGRNVFPTRNQHTSFPFAIFGKIVPKTEPQTWSSQAYGQEDSSFPISLPVIVQGRKIDKNHIIANGEKKILSGDFAKSVASGKKSVSRWKWAWRVGKLELVKLLVLKRRLKYFAFFMAIHRLSFSLATLQCVNSYLTWIRRGWMIYIRLGTCVYRVPSKCTTTILRLYKPVWFLSSSFVHLSRWTLSPSIFRKLSLNCSFGVFH